MNLGMKGYTGREQISKTWRRILFKKKDNLSDKGLSHGLQGKEKTNFKSSQILEKHVMI